LDAMEWMLWRSGCELSVCMLTARTSVEMVVRVYMYDDTAWRQSLICSLDYLGLIRFQWIRFRPELMNITRKSW
jgi:hypothetical protein